MKVLFVLIQNFDPIRGGVEKSTFKISTYLADQGYDCHVYSLDNTTDYENSKLTIHHSEKSGNFKNPVNTQHLSALIRDMKPDVVLNQSSYYLNTHISDAVAEVDAIYLACLRQSLFMFKDNYELQIAKLNPAILRKLLLLPLAKKFMIKRHYRRQGEILRLILDTHDRYIMLTPSNIKELEFFIGKYRSERVMVLPNSIPQIDPVKFDDKKKVLVHVGRLNTVQKKSELLIPLWKKIADRLPDWNFVIVGEGPHYDTMKAEAENIDRIQLVGYQNPSEYYKQAQLFIMPSAYEGFPNTLIEAQSYGCFPFVFDSYAALRDIVSDENAGISEPFDLQNMANQIVEVALDEAQAKSRFEAAQANASKYVINRVGAQWESLFHNLKATKN